MAPPPPNPGIARDFGNKWAIMGKNGRQLTPRRAAPLDFD
jgi:hypothetical protein